MSDKPKESGTLQIPDNWDEISQALHCASLESRTLTLQEVDEKTGSILRIHITE